MKAIFYFVASVGVIACCGTASAQSFTYNSTASAPSTSVGGVRDDGTAYGAQVSASTAEAMMDGKMMKSTSKCITMTQPAKASIFDSHMMCNTEDATGTWTSSWGCSNVGTTVISCIGGMRGLTGAYAKRRGNVTAQIKGNMATGAGEWFK